MWSNGRVTTVRRMNPPGNLRRTLNMLPISPPNFIVNILINLARLINPQAPFSPITSYFSIHDPNFSLILFPSLRVQFVLILCVCDLHKSYITKLSVGNAHFGYALVGSAAAPFGARPMLHPSPYSSSLPPIPPHHYYPSPHRQRLCPNRRQS